MPTPEERLAKARELLDKNRTSTDERGRAKRARQALELLEEERHAHEWVERGRALGYLHRYEEALAAYGEAIRIEPDFARAHTNRGSVLDKLHRYEEAHRALLRIVHIAEHGRTPGNRIEARAVLARVLIRLRDTETAAPLLIKPLFEEAFVAPEQDDSVYQGIHQGRILGNRLRRDRELPSAHGVRPGSRIFLAHGRAGADGTGRARADPPGLPVHSAHAPPLLPARGTTSVEEVVPLPGAGLLAAGSTGPEFLGGYGGDDFDVLAVAYDVE